MARIFSPVCHGCFSIDIIRRRMRQVGLGRIDGNINVPDAMSLCRSLITQNINSRVTCTIFNTSNSYFISLPGVDRKQVAGRRRQYCLYEERVFRDSQQSSLTVKQKNSLSNEQKIANILLVSRFSSKITPLFCFPKSGRRKGRKEIRWTRVSARATGSFRTTPS